MATSSSTDDSLALPPSSSSSSSPPPPPPSIATSGAHVLKYSLSQSTHATSAAHIVKDTLPLAKSASETGFAAAKTATETGFWIAETSLKASSYALFGVGAALTAAGMVTAGPAVIAGGLAVTAANAGVGVARDITIGSQDAAAAVTAASITTVDSALTSAGVKSGEGLRLAFGSDNVDAVSFISAMVSDFVDDVPGDVTYDDLWKAMGAYALLHKNCRYGLPSSFPPSSPLVRPLQSPGVPADVVRYVRFAVAIYGRLPTAFLGVSHAAPAEVEEEDETVEVHSEVEAFSRITGLPKSSVLDSSFGGKTYGPGYIVCVDAETESVVVVIRGTLSRHDVMTDLVCGPSPFSPPSSAAPALAHSGMLASATRLDSRVSPVVRAALASNPGYRVVVTGHSLGAGVATLLASTWGPKFDGAEVTCYAYGPPCTLTIDAARAASPYITSVVCGADFVGRFGLATTVDLREALVALARISRGEREGKLSHGMSDEEALSWLTKAVMTEGPKMFPGGRILWLDEDSSVYEADPSVFHAVAVQEGMFKSHMPQHYLDRVEGLRTPGG